MCEKGNSSVPSVPNLKSCLGQYWTKAIWADRHLVPSNLFFSKDKDFFMEVGGLVMTLEEQNIEPKSKEN